MYMYASPLSNLSELRIIDPHYSKCTCLIIALYITTLYYTTCTLIITLNLA